MLSTLLRKYQAYRVPDPLVRFLTDVEANDHLIDILYPPAGSDTVDAWVTILEGASDRKDYTGYATRLFNKKLPATGKTELRLAPDPVSGRADLPDDGMADLRPLELLTNGMRQFPLNPSRFYGLKFHDEDAPGEPVNAIFLGANGVGKSTLFLSIELAALHRSYTLKSRGLKNISAADYSVAHACGSNPDNGAPADTDSRGVAYLKLVSSQGYLSSDDGMNNRKPSLLPAFFYAEEDYHTLAKNDCTREYLCAQLGLADALALRNLLRAIIRNLEEWRELERKSVAAKPIRRNSVPSPEEKIAPDSKRKQHREFNAKHTLNGNLCEKYLKRNVVMDRLVNLEKYMSESIDNEMTKLQKTAQTIIPALFRDHLDKKREEEIILNLAAEIPSIKIRWKDDIGQKERTPRECLNTFRFTLYVVALKIALACAAMQIARIAFPIVLDDVFDASDFNNRTGIDRKSVV